MLENSHNGPISSPDVIALCGLEGKLNTIGKKVSMDLNVFNYSWSVISGKTQNKDSGFLDV